MAVSYSKKHPRRFDEMPCEDARRRRDAYLDIVRATGELPRTLHEGATVIDAVGKVVDQGLLVLSAEGAAGTLLVAVDTNAKVKWAIAGAFSSLVKPFDARRFAIDVTVPNDVVPRGFGVTDVVNRDDLAIDARLVGLGGLGYDGLFRLGVSDGPDLPANASARDAWVRTLPATKGAPGIVKLPDDGGLSFYDADTGRLRSFRLSEQEDAAFMKSGAMSVVRLSGGAFATSLREGGKCYGRWFDATQKEPRPICAVQPHHIRGARLVRSSEARKSTTEIVDVDDDGKELVLATLAGTSPASVEVLGTAPHQLAYSHGGRVHVETLGAGANATRKSLDLRDSLPCRGDGGCTIEHVRRLETGAALVHIHSSYEHKLYIASAAGWSERPMMSLQKPKEICSVETVHHGAASTEALVHCGDDSPEWHLRTITTNGDMTDALPAKGDVELAELAQVPPATLKLRDQAICVADGLIYRGPACDSLPPRASAKRSK